MCAHTSIQRIICFFQLQIFTTTYIVFGFNRWAGVWGKLTPMKWDVFMNFTQLVCNSQSVWGKITPMKWAVFIKLYPMSKARMSLSKILPQTSKKFTQIYLPYLWHYATLDDHNALMIIVMYTILYRIQQYTVQQSGRN